jgi:hypothetical protein
VGSCADVCLSVCQMHARVLHHLYFGGQQPPASEVGAAETDRPEDTTPASQPDAGTSEALLLSLQQYLSQQRSRQVDRQIECNIPMCSTEWGILGHGIVGCSFRSLSHQLPPRASPILWVLRAPIGSRLTAAHVLVWLASITEDHRMQLVVLGMHIMTFDPYSAAMNRILISVVPLAAFERHLNG